MACRCPDFRVGLLDVDCPLHSPPGRHRQAAVTGVTRTVEPPRPELTLPRVSVSRRMSALLCRLADGER